MPESTDAASCEYCGRTISDERIGNGKIDKIGNREIIVEANCNNCGEFNRVVYTYSGGATSPPVM